MLGRLKPVACVAVLLSPACVVNLTDRYSPEVNGAVSGGAADCSQVQVVPHGAPGGASEPVFVGRYVTTSDPKATPDKITAKFDASGNYVRFAFQGSSQVTVHIALDGDVPQDQLFEFVVDNNPPAVRQITVVNTAAGQPTNQPLQDYDIVDLDPGVPHEVTIHKNTEAQQGGVQWNGIDLHGGTFLPPTRRARRIEFIGDSIMCGYGDEGKNATCPFDITIREAHDQNGNVIIGGDGKGIDITLPVTENQYLSFTSQTARALDADAVTVCWSGKGLYKNFKEKKSDHDATVTVPDLWNTRTILGDGANDKWDFSKEKPEEVPQVVVVGLGTNDYSRDNLPPAGAPGAADPDPNGVPGDNVPDGDMDVPADYEAFIAKYIQLVQQIRQHRPNAHIFLTVPPMLSDQFPLNNARTDLKNALSRVVAASAAAGDTKVYQMDLVQMGYRYGLGCDYHPNLDVHQIMTEQLVGAIRSKTCW